MCRLNILTIFYFLVSIGQAHGQYFFDFDKLSIEDGFTSSRANAIIQDRKGFMWIGTWNGLNCFDGYNCEIFQPKYHDSTAISNREVSALLEDHNGNIWIGTTYGLNCLNPETRELKVYNFQHRIISLFEDRGHDIWVGTWNGGLFKLDSASGVTENYYLSGIISDIHEDSQGNFWVATYQGLVNLDRSTKSFVRYSHDGNNHNSPGHSVITQIEESKNGNLWLGSWGGGLIKVLVDQDRSKIRFIKYMPRDGEGSLSSNIVYRLKYDQFDNLWIGTWDGGLNLLEKNQQNLPPDKAHFYTFDNDLSDPYSISGNNISSIFVDNSGMLWAGSSKIERTNIIKNGVNRYKTNRLENGVLMNNWIRAFAADDDKLIAGGSEEIKVFKYNTGKLHLLRNIPRNVYEKNGSMFSPTSIMSLLYNEKGLWIGTEDAGLILYPDSAYMDSSRKGFQYINTMTNPRIPGNKVISLAASKFQENTIWIGTMQYGFCKLYYENGKQKTKIYSVGYSDKSVSDYNIRSIVEDNEGKVWIGTQNGLNCFDPITEKFEKYYLSQTDSSSINDNVVNVLFQDSAGDLWVGTNLGLNKKLVKEMPDSSTEVWFKGYPYQKGINNGIIMNILEDDSRNLWIGLYRGIAKFNTENEVVENEYSIKEYQHLFPDRNSSLKMKDGSFFFGGLSGLMFFHPNSILKNSGTTEACITGLMINNELVENKSKYTQGKSVPFIDKLELTYKDKIVTFVFSAMNYKDPKKNMYAYLLEGFDDEWNEVGTRNTATYTNIKSGNYVFKVKAANSDGVWNENYTSLTVNVSPPWWKSIVAYIIYFILFVGLLYFFNQYTIIEAREKGRIKIESLQYEKEHELNELKSLFFTNITHEFRTPLTLILGPVEELFKTKELSKYALKQAALIQRNAQRLLRLVNQLMEFRKVEKGKMEIYPQQVDVAFILNDLYDSFKSMADSKDIDFTLTLKSKELPTIVDTEKFEKALFNIVSNAFKYTEEGGKISIWAGVKMDTGNIEQLVIEVEDTGIGISEEHKEKVFERFFQVNQKNAQSTGGIGLYLSKTFIELHNGKIELESELGQGSCFRMLLPLNQSFAVTTIGQQEMQLPVIENDEEVNEKDANIVMITNEASASAQKVLVVEDDSELNDFIVTGLSSDYKVFGCYNGNEGLDLARKYNPDLIITDIMMPEMDGIELCKLLREDFLTSHIPVVFLTARTMQDDEIQGLKIGAVDYIFKPFNLVLLKLKIRNLLDNRKSIHDKMKADNLMEPEMIELSDLDESFLKDAVNAVDSNLDDPTFNVEKFSEVLKVSTNQVYRKIKALTGQTAKEFIRNQRLKAAAQLFLQKKRSISEIIYMVGFSSPSYFTRCFREYFGCTPREFIDKDGRIE